MKTTGDGLHAVFVSTRAALDAALAAQRALAAETWSVPGGLRVRMGLHTGDAAARDGDYYGPATNRAARVMAAAHGEQVVVSHATEEIVRDTLPDEVALLDLGEHRLPDLAGPNGSSRWSPSACVATSPRSARSTPCPATSPVSSPRSSAEPSNGRRSPTRCSPPGS